MSNFVYTQTTPLSYYDPQRLKAERDAIEGYYHEVIQSYGINVLYVSQKKNFPIVPHDNQPTQMELLFQAYGDIIKPEYNEYFQTKAYIKFDTDTFLINQFGLSNDVSMTAFFDKIDFALDGALALADNKTIHRKFKFNSVMSLNEPSCKLSFNDKSVNFNVTFIWDNTSNGDYQTKGEITNVTLNPPMDTPQNQDLYATFKRYYSGRNTVLVSDNTITYNVSNINQTLNTAIISGVVDCTITVKNPYKSYMEYEKSITPAVGDIVIIQTIDGKFEKLEISEVVAENKAVEGINPLLGTYAYQCVCKPFIADNATSPDNIASPTINNQNKLELIDSISQNASELAGQISDYDKIANTEFGQQYQDDVYGGYNINTPMSINYDIVPLSVSDNQQINYCYKWSKYADKLIKINNKSLTADQIYVQLLNLLDMSSADYKAFENKFIIINDNAKYMDIVKVDALNCKLYCCNPTNYKDKLFAYSLPELRLKMILADNKLLNDFIDDNSELIKSINSKYRKGLSYDLPYLTKSTIDTYIDVANDKQASKLFATQIKFKNKQYTIIVDKRDIDKNNLDTDEFKQLLADASKFMPVMPTNPDSINLQYKIGDLLTIWQFNDKQQTRLATNGLKLFVETKLNDELYRAEVNKLDDINFVKSEKYHDQTIDLDKCLSWLSGDEFGIWFNPIKGNRIQLTGVDNLHLSAPTELSYTCDINSDNNSSVITFNASPYGIQLISDINVPYIKLKLLKIK